MNILSTALRAGKGEGVPTNWFSDRKTAFCRTSKQRNYITYLIVAIVPRPGSGLVLRCLGPGFTVLALGPGFRPIFIVPRTGGAMG